MRTFLAAFLLSAGLASAATVDSVVVRQRWPWSRKVDIDYTLVTDKPCQVVVNVYRDGTLLPMPDAAFSGDRLCVTGAKLNTIVFDPTLTPYDGEVLENLRFELVPREFPPYLIIDVSKDKTDPAQVTWVTAYDLTNSASAYGAWTWGSTFHTGPEVDPAWQDAIVWTGVTNSTAYKKSKVVMRYVPPGTYTMGLDMEGLGIPSGDRFPAAWNMPWYTIYEFPHRVTLTKGFYVAVFPVTRNQHAYITTGDETHLSYGNETANRVTYNQIRGSDLGTNWPVSASIDADSVLAKWREKTGFTTLDLPTEAQWEYACRAGTTGMFHDGTSTISENGATSETLAELAWYRANGDSTYHNAGLKRPNGWGLYDMLGNHDEWCHDWRKFSLGTAAVTDPRGAATPDTSGGSGRVVRGGSVWNEAKNVRSSSRGARSPDTTDSSVLPTLCYRLFLTLE